MKTYIVKFKNDPAIYHIGAYSRYAAKSKVKLFYKGRKVEYIEEQVIYDLAN